MKRQAISQRRLIQHLSSNCCLDYSSSSIVLLAAGSKMTEDDDDDDNERLEVLLSEHRMEQALELLELQAQALHSRMQQQEEEAEAAIVVASSIRALSARKARVADRLASVADNPRTPRPELLKALSGLCRLGDAERANHLLFKFYRASVVRGVEELQAHRSSNYIKDLARVVFSSIAQASRGFVALHGHPSPCAPQLVRWAREEMEDLGVAFSEYVRSMPRAAGQSCLALALEAAECAVSSSLLLRQLGIASEQDVLGLVAPCLREAVAMYGRHLKEVVRLLVASDASWVLGRFLMPLLPPTGAVQQRKQQLEQQHCLLLTTSGRKFVTLIQEVVEDVAWPLLNLGMKGDDDGGSSVSLQLVADLFREYMHSVVELIIAPSNSKETGAGEEQERYMWQLSVLINCTTLVSLFPVIAHGISSSSSTRTSSDSSPQRQRQQVDSLISLIKEAAGQVWNCFCQRFIRDTIILSASASAARAAGAPAPPQGMAGVMPSPAFQVVFLRVRRLKNHHAHGGGDDAAIMMKRLLQELMEAIISWLSGNLDSWAVHRAQIQLDVHFLLEFARLGGFSSENIRSSAMELIRRALVREEQDGTGTCRGEEEEEEGCGWAADAARQAVQALLMMDTMGTGQSTDGMTSSGNDDQQAGQQHAATSSPEEDEDHQSGGGAARSSDEFISIEEEEEEDDDEDVQEAAAAAAPAPAPHEMVKQGDEEAMTSRDDDDAMPILQPQQDDEEQVSGERDNDIISGGGGERSKSKGSSSANNAPSRRSRRKREAGSRSSRPRWQ